jgi:hypothetical protein
MGGAGPDLHIRTVGIVGIVDCGLAWHGLCTRYPSGRHHVRGSGPTAPRSSNAAATAGR